MISTAELAISATLEDHPDRAEMLIYLGIMLWRQYNQTRNVKHLENNRQTNPKSPGLLDVDLRRVRHRGEICPRIQIAQVKNCIVRAKLFKHFCFLSRSFWNLSSIMPTKRRKPDAHSNQLGNWHDLLREIAHQFFSSSRFCSIIKSTKEV